MKRKEGEQGSLQINLNVKTSSNNERNMVLKKQILRMFVKNVDCNKDLMIHLMKNTNSEKKTTQQKLATRLTIQTSNEADKLFSKALDMTWLYKDTPKTLSQNSDQKIKSQIKQSETQKQGN